METPDGKGDDSAIGQYLLVDLALVVIVTYMLPNVSTPPIAKAFFNLNLGMRNRTIGIKNTIKSKATLDVE